MFEERLKRICEAIGVKTDTDLASALGIKPPSVAGAKKRSAIPGDWIEKVAKDYHVSADWLLFGRGPMRLGEQPVPQAEAASRASESCSRCVKLERELELERNERRELAQENRQLMRENADLRIQNAVQKDQLRALSGRGVAADSA